LSSDLLKNFARLWGREVNFPSWKDLILRYCSVVDGDNPYYEDFSLRRYNYAASNDPSSCRLIFLKDVLKDKSNKTLRRKGRFVWCRDIKYEGKNQDGVRSVSFTVDHGQKRFHVGENNILSLPSQICVSNHRFFKPKKKTFLPFSSVFSYNKSVLMMAKGDKCSLDEMKQQISNDNPYRVGTLVSPRLGYFYPDIEPDKLERQIKSGLEHPCGIILGPSVSENKYVSKEFYRVRFGDTTYEKIHPVQMEIINEV
jgi:hypothetical protein